MARSITAAVMMRQARELADQEPSPAAATAARVDRTECLGMLNASIGIWHGLLVKAIPERFEVSVNVSATGASSYALPDAHLMTLGVDFEFTSNSFWPLKRVQFQERTRYDLTADVAEGYYLKAATLVLVPSPPSGTYRHSYVACATPLVDDGDAVDGVNGWEMWPVYDLAVKMMIKEESDPSALIIERDKIKAEIEAAAADRDAATPMRVVDTRLKRY